MKNGKKDVPSAIKYLTYNTAYYLLKYYSNLNSQQEGKREKR